MRDTILAVAAILGTMVNLAMLLMHCRRDKQTFRRIEETKVDER